MNMTKRKVVSSAVRMQALALFTMANQNYLRAAAYSKALMELLDIDDTLGSHLNDTWLDDNANFDKAFAADGFTVRPAKVNARRKRK